MRIALVARSSDTLAPHADPNSRAEAARVTSLGQALQGLGHRVTIYDRRDSHGLPDSAIIAPGITVGTWPRGRRTAGRGSWLRPAQIRPVPGAAPGAGTLPA